MHCKEERTQLEIPLSSGENLDQLMIKNAQIVRQIKKVDYQLVKSMSAPPNTILITLEYLFMLIDPQSLQISNKQMKNYAIWQAFKKISQNIAFDNFLENFNKFSYKSITDQQLKNVLQFYHRVELDNEETIKRIHSVDLMCVQIYQWSTNIVKMAQIARRKSE